MGLSLITEALKKQVEIKPYPAAVPNSLIHNTCLHAIAKVTKYEF